MQTVYQLILLFTIYSFVGWACETAYCSIPAKRFINRGFLNGPFCPVYGFGALLVIYPLEPLSDHIVLLFLCGMIITSLLEYLTAYILEVCFHTKWWDYSQKKFNIHGRVCLKNSLLFGVMSVLLVKLLHPWVQWLLKLLPDWLVPLVSFFLVGYFVTDSAVTVRSIPAVTVQPLILMLFFPFSPKRRDMMMSPSVSMSISRSARAALPFSGTENSAFTIHSASP